MKKLTNLFSLIWTAYALVVFVVLGSIFFIVEFVLLLLGDFTYRAAHRWPAFCTKILLFFWGVRVVQHNKQLLHNMPHSVIVLNHRSDLDALVATAYMPGMYKFIGKEDLTHYPFIGQLVKKLYITVDRRSVKSRTSSLRNMKKESNKGANIVVFPEGWANFSMDYLLELKRGAFKVALDKEMPILICTLIGTHELFPKPKISLTPGRVDMYWETFIDTKGKTFEKDFTDIKTSVEQIIINRLKKEYPKGYQYQENQANFEEWKEKQLKK